MVPLTVNVVQYGAEAIVFSLAFGQPATIPRSGTPYRVIVVASSGGAPIEYRGYTAAEGVSIYNLNFNPDTGLLTFAVHPYPSAGGAGGTAFLPINFKFGFKALPFYTSAFTATYADTQFCR